VRSRPTCARASAQAWERSTRAFPDVLCRVHAEIETVHVAGDHDIVIGRVLDLENPVDDSPLVFYRGRFGLHPDSAFAIANLYGWDDHWE
jgi:flavin reductase (DIM6/NTAB) family NADH-FMN oxidoreductase RutF